MRTNPLVPWLVGAAGLLGLGFIVYTASLLFFPQLQLPHETQQFLSPSGQRAIVMETRSDLIDPLYTLIASTEQGRTKIGCVNGDYYSLPLLTWEGDDNVKIVTLWGNTSAEARLSLAGGRLAVESLPDEFSSC